MVKTITVNDAHDMIKAGGAVLIDVREPDEFKAEHIPYAMSVPLGMLDGGIQTLAFPKDRAIIFQCAKGGRSAQACHYVTECGACENDILNMEGGIMAWSEAGLPLILT